MKGAMIMDAQRMIRNILKHKHITQQELADKVGKPFNTLRNILYGKNMTCDTLEQLADALGCDVVLIDRKTRKQFRP